MSRSSTGLAIDVHPDGDDFAWLFVPAIRIGMTLLEFEYLTTPHDDPHRRSRLGTRLRAVIEALRRSNQRTFVFTPSDPTPLYLSEEWVLHARETLEDAIWILDRIHAIRSVRKLSRRPIELKWGSDHCLTFILGPKPPDVPWHCRECKAEIPPFENVCATPGCASHERYTRCTGNPVSVIAFPLPALSGVRKVAKV